LIIENLFFKKPQTLDVKIKPSQPAPKVAEVKRRKLWVRGKG
jgi:hypothetical protein